MADQAYHHSLTNHTPDNYNKHADFVYSAKNTAPIFELLEAKPGERIIDLGCGTGELTEIIREAVGDAGEVWGVDSSESMLLTAREKTDAKRITYAQVDIQAINKSLHPSLKGSFDAVFSSATFHWCKANPGGVLDSVEWLLKPGGRLAFEMGGFGNAIGVRSAVHEVLRKRGVDPIPLDPWYFPTVGQYESLLRLHGMIPGDIKLVPRPTPLPSDLRGWLNTFVRGTFFASFGDEDTEVSLSEVEEMCRPDAYWSLDNPGMGMKPDEGIGALQESSTYGWEIMYVRLRGIAKRKVDGQT